MSGLMASWQPSRGSYSPNEDVRRESGYTGKVCEKGITIRLFFNYAFAYSTDS